MNYYISIDRGINNYLEKKFFECENSMAILKYLIIENKKDYLKKYFKIAKNKQIELEITKNEIFNLYKPNDIIVKSYIFNFENSEIICTI